MYTALHKSSVTTVDIKNNEKIQGFKQQIKPSLVALYIWPQNVLNPQSTWAICICVQVQYKHAYTTVKSNMYRQSKLKIPEFTHSIQ